uniref:Uncharacterized protein n=1 Tax=Rhizophora mucronata TaxID=61149 RepID=A0A2P2MXX2_RHIMU
MFSSIQVHLIQVPLYTKKIKIYGWSSILRKIWNYANFSFWRSCNCGM